MKNQNLKALLGDDYDQLSANEIKDRVGEKTKDFNPIPVPSPLSNDEYARNVNAKAGEYFNIRNDMLQDAYSKDKYSNDSYQNIAKSLYKGRNVPKIIEKDMDNYGGYLPDSNEIELNKNYPRDVNISTLVHELKHARNVDNNSNNILDIINSTTLPQNNDIPKSRREYIHPKDINAAEIARLNNDFKTISDLYNRGHFFGNDQIETIAEDTYKPNVFTKFKNALKGK